ncbi:MAG: SPOR domain-containing protein [Bacteroidales bacterium]|nr:SPOR domain-containing protein [Bacteroidales bacterium]
MKTTKMLTAGMLLCSMLFVGCKSNKEAHNAAYERAKARQEAQQTTAPSQKETIEVVQKSDVKEASEAIQIITGTANGTYGVVIGSFLNRTNAENLQKRMINNGYPQTVLAQNEKLMFRVIVAFFNNKPDAQEMVKKLKSDYPDAWILIKE